MKLEFNVFLEEYHSPEKPFFMNFLYRLENKIVDFPQCVQETLDKKYNYSFSGKQIEKCPILNKTASDLKTLYNLVAKDISGFTKQLLGELPEPERYARVRIISEVEQRRFAITYDFRDNVRHSFYRRNLNNDELRDLTMEVIKELNNEQIK